MGMLIKRNTNNIHLKSLRELSSAGTISNIADGAAALAILEKTRNQICILDQIIANTQATLSLIQTDNDRETADTDQNHLEHTINLLTTSKENLASAGFHIRDVDMAFEMFANTKQNVLN